MYKQTVSVGKIEINISRSIISDVISQQTYCIKKETLLVDDSI